MMKVTDTVFNVGVYDATLDLFEGQYPLKEGVTYNSYVILDDQIAILDTVDQRAIEEWLAHLDCLLADRQPSYLIVSHMEPDHGAGLERLVEKYPDITIVGNAKTFQMIDQFFTFAKPYQRLLVKEGDELVLGRHTLQFILAPMVHWPEVMMSYEKQEKILFSADAFGTFHDSSRAWIEEARRYYCNIVGKYGMQVQTVLKKAAKLDFETICPLHGPVLKDDLSGYLRAYQLWSTYTPEKNGVLLACASIHGHTWAAVESLKSQLEMQDDEVEVVDLNRVDVSEAVAKAFQYDRLVLAASSYDGGVFTPMADFLTHLKSKNFQRRCVGLIQNGSWAPSAAKTMQSLLEGMKEMEILEPVVTIKGALKPEQQSDLERLAKHLMTCGCQGEDCAS